VIKSFRDSDTERLFHEEWVQQWQAIESVARRKLAIVNAASKLSDLKIPPKNRLEKLKADRDGQHSIRINDQYRVSFVFRDGDAYDVEITNHYD
jgi:toxin HigB-1